MSPASVPAGGKAPSTPQRRAPSTPQRRAAIAKIQIARKALALDDGSYRALLRRITGLDSSALCSEPQLVAVLEEFKRLGFAAPTKRRSEKPHVRKIYALWKALKPHLTNGSDAALAAFVKRQTGVDKPEWLDAQQGNKVVEGLKAWLKRVHPAGVDDGC